MWLFRLLILDTKTRWLFLFLKCKWIHHQISLWKRKLFLDRWWLLTSPIECYDDVVEKMTSQLTSLWWRFWSNEIFFRLQLFESKYQQWSSSLMKKMTLISKIVFISSNSSSLKFQNKNIFRLYNQKYKRRLIQINVAIVNDDRFVMETFRTLSVFMKLN